MDLIAKKSLRYAGRSLVPGDKFEASAKDARLLKAIGKAVDAGEATPGEARKEVGIEPIKPAKGAYRTRRMKAEDPTGEAPTSSEPAADEQTAEE